MPQTISLRESVGKTAAKQLQRDDPVAARQNERPASRPPTKAHGAVKGDIKRLRLQLVDGVPDPLVVSGPHTVTVARPGNTLSQTPAPAWTGGSDAK